MATPAGWYPDPERDDHLRYWDGHAWTEHTAVTHTSTAISPQDPPGRRHPLRKWLLVGGLVAVLVFAGLWIFGFVAYLNHGHPIGFLSEPVARQANEVCARYQAQLPAPPGEGATVAERAAVVDATAEVYEAMARDLGALPVTGEDVAVLREWVGTWDAFNSVGRRYADAIRRDDPRKHDIGNEGDDLDRELGEFAENNSMPACA